MSTCEEKDTMKDRLNKLMEEYKVQPVGNGYIDCIITENIGGFINKLTKLDIHIGGLTWWCHCKKENAHLGCPHGRGGPRSKYHDGWFSEMCFSLDERYFDMHFDNEYAKEYIFEGVKKEKFYSPCLVPGLWLDIDDCYRDWEL